MQRSTVVTVAGLIAAQASAQVIEPPAPTAPGISLSTPQKTTGSAATAASATTPKATKWDVNAPPGMVTRQVRIAVDQGSWMNVDVSPDGRTLAFDLLGDIYTMPITGGRPTRIAEGLAYEQQPRWSPDGKRIAFTSDRGGGDNIWIMDAGGGNKRQVTKEDFRLLNQPSWSPDGRYIAAKKHFTTARSLGTGEVWLYHVSGGGGVPLVKRASEMLQKELGEPTYAPDGHSIYYTRNVTPGPVFEYAQNSRTDLFDIERYDLNTGEVTTVVSGDGGSVRPTPSPDGRYIAFVRREHGRSKLWVKDLTTGEERRVYDALDQDVQETWAVTGVYPNMSWTPDGRSLVFWAGGHINRVNADGSGASVIPFRVDDTRVVIDALHPVVDVAPARFTTKMVRWAAVSPDERTVVFESLGHLWLKPMAGGEPRRLTASGDAREAYPAWSRDGRQIAFVSWTDAGLGQVDIVPAGGGRPRVVTNVAGHYASPCFSPDGRTIVVEVRDAGVLSAPQGLGPAGSYRVATTGGTPVRVPGAGRQPQFGADNDRLFSLTREKGKLQLISTDMAGHDKRTHATGDLVNDFIVSPASDYLAFRQNYQAFVTPLMPGGQDVQADPKGGALPAVRVSGDGADFIHWSSGGRVLHWSVGPAVFAANTAALFRSQPDDDAPQFTAPPPVGSLAMTVDADKPVATVALVGAKLVTMASRDGGVVADGTVVIRGDRITAIGPRASVAVPPGATVIDVTGKTIIPGLVDAHAHGPQGDDGLVPQQNWSAIANLALGTTTIHDPSARSAEIFAAAEMQRAGHLLSPRIFSTGEVIYGAKLPELYAEINGLDDALADVRRLKSQGARSVKNYNQPRREQRQMVVAAAQREGVEVVPEGGSLFAMDISLIQDGNATLEHNLPVERFYADVVSLWTQTKTNYTPTLIVTYGGPAGEPYWRQHMDVWRHPILSRHEPPAMLEAQNVRREMAADEDFVDGMSAREAKKLADKGVQVAIGAHGQQAGLGAHWEMWSFVRGGWSNIDALRAGTIMPATSLGMARDIGSLEPGKLADLVVLDTDPTADIRNTDKVHRVMLGGRLYDPLTMDEVMTGSSKRAAYWWERAGASGRAGAAVGDGTGD